MLNIIYYCNCRDERITQLTEELEVYPLETMIVQIYNQGLGFPTFPVNQ